ncbi:hypothetical protein [Flavobacterium sp. GT3R68]|uniref:hypothetical protein n=1 Tax=Flavobacterium sp. GT3R68 TaxID=2594437 RepID=UPI000F88AEB7|nr:hypothetical protein [Flavobacterium sp. GT3R68]RTY94976.1 hypothetical protein EKL32_08635 [Flavobacterium sp. GSN2]TRW91781.1 hypothetical protein FNW07_07810 [Flavobacterium sp. GT3R68]
MTKFKFLFLLLATTTFFVSCDPSDNDSNSNDTFAENFGNTTSKDFLGQVVDEDNNPIQNVAIKIGTSTVQTDVNGVFIINDANVYEKFAYITAKKSGFIDGSRAVVPTSGTNRVKIMLLSGSVVAQVHSGVSEEAVLSNGTKVIFDGNFKTETGVAYSGTVNVIMHHLDPTDPYVADKMPGMLFAESVDGQAKVLQTYGMMNVELRGGAGQKLQISNTAQIEMPITPTQLATAPATIPLWHFDEMLGYWKEQGSAVKQGNKYVGTVSHFSWWNCDVQFPTVTLTVTFVDVNGNPLSNVGVGLTTSAVNSYVQYSNGNGQVSGLIPANESLTLHVYDFCGNVIYSTPIGSFSVNTILPNVVLTNEIQTTLVEGTLLKCDNTIVTNGYVMMSRNGISDSFAPVTNGSFNFHTSFCNPDTNFRLKGFDFDNLQTTDPIAYNFTAPVTHVGNLIACNTVTEMVSYKIDSQPVKYILSSQVYAATDISNSPLLVSGFAPSQGGIHIWGTTNVPGIYTTAEFSLDGLDVGGHIGSTTTNTMTFNLSNFGAVGEYVDITFYGTYTDDNTTTHTISGLAHVIRDN